MVSARYDLYLMYVMGAADSRSCVDTWTNNAPRLFAKQESVSTHWVQADLLARRPGSRLRLGNANRHLRRANCTRTGPGALGRSTWLVFKNARPCQQLLCSLLSSAVATFLNRRYRPRSEASDYDYPTGENVSKMSGLCHLIIRINDL